MTQAIRSSVGCVLLGVLASLAAAQEAAAPHAARRVPFEETFHGVTLTDPYHWLEDFDSAEASAFLSAQDQFARVYLARMPGQEFLRLDEW